MSTSRRQRVSIPAAQLVVAPASADVDTFAAPAFGEHVAQLASSASDRTEGRTRYEVVVDGWRFEVIVEPAERAELRERALAAAAEHHVATDTTLRAQIPGRIVRLWVTDGEQVEQGHRLLAVEAMKMENEIRAPHPGVVRAIRVAPGDRVERGDELLTVVQ